MCAVERPDVNERLDNVPNNLGAGEESPWYLLATVCGEQDRDRFDSKLNARNRQIWNRWFIRFVDSSKRESLCHEGKVDIADFEPLSDGEKAEIVRAAKRRGVRVPSDEDWVSSKKILFDGFQFEKIISLSGFIIPGSISFKNCTLSREIFLRDTVVFGFCDFEGVEFKRSALFSRLTISGWVSFDHARFFDLAEFDQAELNFSRFQHTEFSGFARFISTKLKSSSIFFETKFGVQSAFSECEFSGTTHFPKVLWRGPVTFDSATFRGPAYMPAMSFNGRASFKGVKFEREVTFDQTRFESAPDFRDAVLSFSTTWWDVEWPNPPTSVSGLRDSKEAYAALRHAMIRAERPDQALDFYVLELMCKKQLENFTNKLVIQLYMSLADGGRSVIRPCLWWLLGISVSFILHAYLLKSGYFNETAVSYEILRQILSSAVVFGAPIFDSLKFHRFEVVVGEVPIWLQLFQVIHVGFSAVCIFLFGLSLRNLLRIR